MSEVEVNLSVDEKNYLINHLKKKQESISQGKIVYERELAILTSLVSNPPAKAPLEWVSCIESKLKFWIDKVDTIDASAKYFDKVIKMISTSLVLGIEKEQKDIKQCLHDIMIRERDKKQLEAKYQFYPRLKKAKERNLYVFSNKIKTIMESEYVRIN